MDPRIYVLDDDSTAGELVSSVLNGHGGFRTELFERAPDLFTRCEEEPPDAVITDLVMPDMNGIEVTKRLRVTDPFLPIFVLTGEGSISTAIDALRAGATEYLTKPANIKELITLLTRALDERPLIEDAATLAEQRETEFSTSAIIGEHSKVEAVRDFVRKMADIPRSTILLLGESGTGKNLVAQALHYSSSYAKGRFIEVNCSALPAQLLEAELFGYNKGAFTDAREAKRGLIELADGGTLFLDELGDMPLELQAKLLQFLESRRFRRLGGTEEIEVDLRLVAATNCNLEDAVQNGTFRQDLYYRVSVVSHRLPPLREIKSDIPRLVDQFRMVYGRDFRKPVSSVADAALQALADWDWPGNVRELRNVIERAVIFAEGDVLERVDIPQITGAPAIGSVGNGNGSGNFRVPSGLTLAEAEREYVRLTFERCGGSVQRTAEVLGISRKTLWEKRKRYGLMN